MPIDFNQPIETVPCERNPIAVPCEVWKPQGKIPVVCILGTWLDQDGHDESGVGYSVYAETGKFRSLDGAIRNVTGCPHPLVTDVPELPTLRDQFARKAMEVMLFRQRTMSAATIAEGAYTVADAMLKERAK